MTSEMRDILHPEVRIHAPVATRYKFNVGVGGLNDLQAHDDWWNETRFGEE
jgi:hypothetical protein